MPCRIRKYGGSYQKMRAWGELVDILWEGGDVAASMNLEDLFDQLNKKIGIAMFCSYLMDNFNGDVHACCPDSGRITLTSFQWRTTLDWIAP